MLDYLAPEQIEGRAADGRTDQYSLACAGFEFLCGVPPFGPDQGQTLMYAQIYADPPAASARRAGISAAVDSVLATALAKDPADRYPSCGRFAEELRAALRLRPGEPADPPWSPAPHGNGPVSGPRPASAGRVLLRVKQRQRPGAEDRPAATTDRRRSGLIRTGRREPTGHRRPTGHRQPTGHRRASPGRGRRRSLTPRPARRIRRPAGARAGGRCRGRRGRRGRIRCRPIGGIGSRPPGRRHPYADRLLAAPVAVIAVSGRIAVGAGYGARAGGRPGRAADLERRRPDGAAQRGHPGRRLHSPVRRGQPAPGRRESARRAG